MEGTVWESKRHPPFLCGYVKQIEGTATANQIDGVIVMSINIILADDHGLMRRTQPVVLQEEPDFEIIGEACTGQEAVELAEKLRPDVVIMDINMPELNGIEATCRLQQNHPEIRVVGFSVCAKKAYVLAMLNAGALGYVLKESPVKELRQAIRAAYKGQIYVSSDIHGMLSDENCEIDKRPDFLRVAKRSGGYETTYTSEVGRERNRHETCSSYR